MSESITLTDIVSDNGVGLPPMFGPIPEPPADMVRVIDAWARAVEAHQGDEE